MAAIASSRIASGGGVYHKPQANDANSVSGTDASSSFQQILSTTAAGSSPVPPAQDQDTSNQQDSGKKSGKDTKTDSKVGPSKTSPSKTSPSKTSQAQQNAVVAAADSKTLIQASAANDGSQNDTGAIDSGSSGAATSQNTDAIPGQASDPSAQQIAADANQTLVAAQISAPAQGTQAVSNSSAVANDSCGNDGSNAGATLLDSIVNNSAAPTQTISADDAATSSASVTGTSSDASKSGKAKRDSQDAVAAQIQIQDPSTQQANSATQAPAPAAKKDHKSAKTDDQGNSNTANVQAAQPDSTIMVAMAASAAPLSTAPAPASAADSNAGDALAAAAAGPAKSGQARPNSNSNPPAGATPQSSGNQASNAASNSPSANGPQSSPAGASTASQDGSAIQGTNASQSADNKPPAGDKNNTQAAAAPAQPQVQAAQPQPQIQDGVLPVQPQQVHAGAADSITQNVQVSQGDSSAATNTVGALAVAISAKSQSGNKQFDIRLDPPDLGRVEVRLSIDTTGKVQASLSADQPRTLDLLKTDAPALTRALRDAGLNVAQNGLNFSLRGQSQQNSGNSFTPRSGRAAQSLIATSSIGSVPGGANYQGPADGRLDIRV